MVAERTLNAASVYLVQSVFVFLLFKLSHIIERLSTVDVTAPVQIAAGLSQSGLKTKKKNKTKKKYMPDCEAIVFCSLK